MSLPTGSCPADPDVLTLSTEDLPSGCFDDKDGHEVSPLALKPSHLFDIQTAEPVRGRHGRGDGGPASVRLEYASLSLTPGLRVTALPEADGSFFGAIGGGCARYSESKLKADRSPNFDQRDTNAGALAAHLVTLMNPGA